MRCALKKRGRGKNWEMSNTHMIGVFVYGALGIGLVALAAALHGGPYALLACAVAAGVAWISQNFHALGNPEIGGLIAWLSLAATIASAILTLLGV